jgi:serine/threonine protein kinase
MHEARVIKLSVFILRVILIAFITLTLATFWYSTPSQYSNVQVKIVEPIEIYEPESYESSTKQDEIEKKLEIFRDIEDFEIIGMLGEGGFGDVYRAKYLGQEVAIKVPNDRHKDDGYDLEYKFLLILKGSSHIIPLVTTIPSLRALVMPIFQYGDLMTFIRAKSSEIRFRVIPESVLLHIAIHLSIAVQQGIFVFTLIPI